MFSVLVGSWNVATHTPTTKDIPDLNLVNWLEKSLSPAPELIVLGFQELLPQMWAAIQPTFQEAYWIDGVRTGHTFIDNLEIWYHIASDAIQQIHGQGASYQPLWMGRRAAIGMIVFIKQGIVAKSLSSGCIGTGLGGFYGNKGDFFNIGAVGLSVELKSEKYNDKLLSCCFISSHLGPHAGEQECIWRTMESQHIIESLIFKPCNGYGQGYCFPRDHDMIWFFGDLNYRLKGDKELWAIDGKKSVELPKRSQVLEWIRDNNINALLEHDELIHLRKHGFSLIGKFDEPPIKFLPSYKLITKSKQIPRLYSTSRLPAYCDRILYTQRTEHMNMGCLYYDRIQGYTWSDHDPVIALFHFDPAASLGRTTKEWQSLWTRRSSFLFQVNQTRFLSVLVFSLFWLAWRLA